MYVLIYISDVPTKISAVVLIIHIAFAYYFLRLLFGFSAFRFVLFIKYFLDPLRLQLHFRVIHDLLCLLFDLRIICFELLLENPSNALQLLPVIDAVVLEGGKVDSGVVEVGDCAFWLLCSHYYIDLKVIQNLQINITSHLFSFWGDLEALFSPLLLLTILIQSSAFR